MKTGPPYIVYPPPPFISSFSQPPLPCRRQSQTTLLFLLSCFFGWMGDCAIFDELFYLMVNLFMPNLGTLVLERPSCVFCATRCQVYWGLTHDVFFCWYSDLISHTQTHTAHSGASRLIHHINIYLHHMCSQQLFLLHWMNNSLISKMYFPKFLFFSKIIHL